MAPPSRFIHISSAAAATTRRLLFRAAIIPSSSSTHQVPPRRPLSNATSSAAAAPFSFGAGPAPPRLPPAEQAEFERLQREAAGLDFGADMAGEAVEAGVAAAATVGKGPAEKRAVASTVAAAAEAAASKAGTPGTAAAATTTTTTKTTIPATQLFSGGIRKGAPPEFEGDSNPRTGEVGGPRNEPLRWGSRGDWSYNGRVTDF